MTARAHRLLEAGLDIVEINGANSSGFAGQHTLLSSKAFASSKIIIWTTLPPQGLPSGDAAYHNREETTNLRQMAAANPDVASLQANRRGARYLVPASIPRQGEAASPARCAL